MLPKGTSFMANAWTIQQNERNYLTNERPGDFVIERLPMLS